jgi:hypothetical protein
LVEEVEINVINKGDLLKNNYDKYIYTSTPSLENLLKTSGKTFGKENLWKTYRKPLKNLWRRKPLENLWKISEKTSRKSLESLWKSSGKPLENL